MSKHDPDTHGFVMKEGQTYSGLSITSGNYDEAIKASNLYFSRVEDFIAKGGSEDVIDCVRGQRYEFENGELQGNLCRQFITIKGGVRDYVLASLRLKGEPKGIKIGPFKLNYDIMLGDHTIYGYGTGPVGRGLIDYVSHESGRKVRVLCIHAHKPVTRNGDYTIRKLPSILVKALFWFKKITGRTTKPV